MLRLIENEEEVQTEVRSVLDKIVREGAQKMLITALQCEVDEYVAKFEGEKDAENHRLVTRHGKAQNRTILTGAGALEIEMYTSERYTTLLEVSGAVISMSKRGDCYDNAVAESFLAGSSASMGFCHTRMVAAQTGVRKRSPKGNSGVYRTRRYDASETQTPTLS